MAGADLSIKFEIEPVVKLYCMATDCKHNLCKHPSSGWIACNLKVVEIGADGKCASYEPREEAAEAKPSSAYPKQ